MFSRRLLIICISILLAITTTAHAQPPQITSSLSYLSSSQNPDGTWQANTSLVESNATTTTVLETLRLLNQTAGTAYSTGSAWLQGQSLQGVDPIAGRVRALALTGSSVDGLIPLLNPLSGAWGGDADHETVNLDTALALQALTTANYPDQTIITSALNYLTSTQNPDGGWGFASGDDSSIYVTAIVSSTLQRFLQTTTLATARNRATSYLLALQNADGGFGSPASTTHETALAYSALVAVITDATALGKAVNYLTSTQSADGSWLQDPYSTALALQALHYSEYRPTLPLPPTTGTLAGKVVSAATREPLAGVTVSLANNPVIVATTDSTGNFKLDNIPQGAQQIALSMNGYATTSLIATVTAGGISNLGTLTLANASPSGIVQGVITDEATKAPLAGVIVKVYVNLETTPMAAITSADGSFRITDVAPEYYVMSASKEGYTPIFFSGSIVAGGVLDFSPVLSTKPLSSTSGELTGKVVDDSISAPIAGAVITIVGTKTYSTFSDSSGDYRITNIEAISGCTLRITASGYYDWNSNYALSFGVGAINYQGTKRLIPAPSATSISGKVTDKETNMPIANAEVGITGTGIATKTNPDGTYSIQGINLLNFELKASAPGHFDKSYVLTNQYHGSYTVDFDIVASPAADTRIMAFNTDRGVYAAYDNVAVVTDILNSGTLPATATVSVSVVTAQGEVVANLPFTEPDADGIARSSITFQPGMAKTLNLTWGTGSRSPGDYTVTVKIMADTGVIGLDSMVVAQQSKTIVIEPTQTIATLSLTPLPRFVNLGATEQIGMQASVVNRSNVPAELLFTYDWRGPDGAILHTGSGAISLQPEEASKSVLLESFPFTFNASGEHPLQLGIASGPMPVNLAGGVVSVTPGIRIEPSQSLTPAAVIPDGDKRVRMNIRLKGVVSK